MTLVDVDDLVRAWDEHAAHTDFRGNGPTFTAYDVRNWLVAYGRQLDAGEDRSET